MTYPTDDSTGLDRSAKESVQMNPFRLHQSGPNIKIKSRQTQRPPIVIFNMKQAFTSELSI
jgi:hypothetical protein